MIMRVVYALYGMREVLVLISITRINLETDDYRMLLNRAEGEDSVLDGRKK